mgnify:FL=1
MPTAEEPTTCPVSIFPDIEPENIPAEAAAARVIDTASTDKLRNECVGCRVRITRIATVAGFDNATKGVIAEAIGLDEFRAVSGGTRLYDMKHPRLKEANECLTAVGNYWRSMTIPLAANSSESSTSVEGGVRLLRRRDINDFHRKMLGFDSECRTIVEKMNEPDNRRDILDAAKKMLGRKYDPTKYPARFTFGIQWAYPNVELPNYMAQIAPEAYAHERAMGVRQMNETLQKGQEFILTSLLGVVSSWVDRLGPVIRIYPPPGHPHRDLAEAEILKRVRPGDENTDATNVSPGSFYLAIRSKGGEAGTRAVERIIGPFTETEYQALHPSQVANERKTFRTTTVENLGAIVAQYRRMAEILGFSQSMDTTVKMIEDHVSKFANVGQLDHELRNSDLFRRDTHQLMQQVNARLENELAAMSGISGPGVVRRRITIRQPK